jgi:hypothetical protein
MVLSVVHPDQFRAGALADPAWVPVHIGGVVATPLSIVGWVAVYRRFRNAFGERLARAALSSVIVGALAAAADQVIEAVLPSVGAPLDSRTVSEVVAGLMWVQWAQVVTAIASVPGAVAITVVGFRLWRDAVPPRLAWLIVASLPLGGALVVGLAGQLSPDSVWPTISTLGVVLSFGFAWAGLDLASGTARRAATP